MHFTATSAALATPWWGYAEADPTLVGVVVVAIAILAMGYVVSRAFRSRKLSRTRKQTPGRG